MTKQAYYQYDEDAALAKAAREEFALQYIRETRRVDPGIGGMKLWYMYRAKFGCDEPIGRDRFCRIIDEFGLKVRMRLRKPRTTDSTHGLPTYPNLVKDFIPTAANQLWVSDITYIVVMDDECHYHFVYLSLILDAYSEEVVGWSVGPTLDTDYPMAALKTALKRLDGKDVCLIHHSDRGCQYASREYTDALRDHEIRISMTESGDPRDNAQAERINNTMKNELLKGMRFGSLEQVKEAVSSAVCFYNEERPHMSVNMMTPREASLCTGEITKKWTSFRERRIKEKKDACINPDICLPLLSVQGDPSGLRPPVTP